jgi:16S rRNA (cytidine1402-2'-O)-methyltransferase
MPALYVVATPIGNLEDMTLRAIRILKEVKLIAAEDTRQTRHLLSAYDIKTPTTSYHEHNKLTKLDYVLKRLENEDIALVSDAGMPGISDPGYELIRAVSQHGIPVVPIPGPSVLVTALAVSGLPTDSFLYLGFLPHKAGERRRLLKSKADESATLVLLESPHRVQGSLSDLLDILGDRKIAVCRELTKVHEEIFRGTISQALQHLSVPAGPAPAPARPRGEFTLVIAGKAEAQPELNADIEERLHHLSQAGLPARAAITQIAGETGLSRKELYQVWIKNK